MNKQGLRLIFAILLLAIVLTGCQKNPVGSVTGTVTTYDPSTPLIKIGLDSVWVYLVNMDFKADTINTQNNRAARIDSVFTDKRGKYSFLNLPEGNYAVIPFATKGNYQFLRGNDGPTCTFSIVDGTSDHEINFSAPLADSENDGDKFHMTIKQIGAPEGSYLELSRGEDLIYAFSWYKRCTITGDSYLYEDGYGWTAVAYTVEDSFLISAYVPFYGQIYLIKKMTFYWLLGQMPDKITVTIDWNKDLEMKVEVN